MIILLNAWYTNWPMWSAIGQWLGAIATLLAVIVALKQSNDAKKIAEETTKTKLEIIWELEKKYEILVTATNTNVFPVYIKKVLIYFNENSNYYIALDHYPENITKKVEPGDTVEFALHYTVIHDFLTDMARNGKNFNYSKNKRYKFRITFYDSLQNEFDLKFTYSYQDVENDNKVRYTFKSNNYTISIDENT